MDSSAAFVAQTGVAGTNGYGTFSIDAGGAWTYTMNSAHDEFVGGTTYTDSFTVATADGTSQVITVSILGTNDAAVITGSSTASLTETNAAQTPAATSMPPTWTARRPSWRRAGVAGSNGYGTLQHRRRRRLDLHHEQRPRRVRGRHDLHRQLHGGHRRRHDARSSPSASWAPTMRR